MNTYVISLLLAFLCCSTLTPIVLMLARWGNLVDTAGMSMRKVHAQDIPRLGGVAIVIAFYAPIIALAFYETYVGEKLLENEQLVWGLLGGAACIAALGLYDDLYGASPKLKLIVQITVATAVVGMGFGIEKVDPPFLSTVNLGLLSWPISILWIVGVTNAVNLIDGLDGLAAGMALFGLAPMTIIALYSDNIVLALICCSLTGSLLGFLVFNFHPARIFMGDSGSMFLGFVLAVVAVYSSMKGRAAVALLTPILALGVPILDTLLALARRAWFGQPLFVGDRQHIHHRLLESGMSHRRTVLVMYGFAGLFASLALATTINRDFTEGIVLGMSVLIAAILLRKIGYLAIPQGMNEEVALSSALRARNKLLKEAIPKLDDRLAKTRELEEIVSHVAELLSMVGARRARLDLTRTRPEEPIRSWSWASPVGDEITEKSFTFPLIGEESNILGSLVVWWSVDRSCNEGLIQLVEGGCKQLSSRIESLRGLQGTAAGEDRSMAS